MKIVNLSQTTNTDAWLHERLRRITGTKSGSLALAPTSTKSHNTGNGWVIKRRDEALEKSKKAKTQEEAAEYYQKAQKYDKMLREAEPKTQRLKTGLEFWKFLAETLADQPDDEPPMARGHRLEPENIQHTLEQLGYKPEDCVTDCGIWESDEDDRLACSPDAYENTGNPTWAIECKSLGSAYHLQAVIPWMVHNQTMNTDEPGNDLLDLAEAILPECTLDHKASGFDFIPDRYKAQVLQYFVVCDTLGTLYFSMYDPRIFGEASHQIIPIHRKDIEPLIAEHKQRQLTTLHLVDTISKMTGATF